MRNLTGVLAAMMIAILSAGCRAGPLTAGPTPRITAEVTASLSAPTADAGAEGPVPACVPAEGLGTVAPAISIHSIAFVVNGLGQVVADGEALQASPGDEVKVREVLICADSFPGTAGGACADLVPVDETGQEITSEHAGTHIVQVTPGLMTVPGPDRLWIVGDSWREFSAVLNHWPAAETEDTGCADGDCERDDWMSVPIR